MVEQLDAVLPRLGSSGECSENGTHLDICWDLQGVLKPHIYKLIFMIYSYDILKDIYIYIFNKSIWMKFEGPHMTHQKKGSAFFLSKWNSSFFQIVIQHNSPRYFYRIWGFCTIFWVFVIGCFEASAKAHLWCVRPCDDTAAKPTGKKRGKKVLHGGNFSLSWKGTSGSQFLDILTFFPQPEEIIQK